MVLSPSTVTWGIRDLAYEFWVNKIQSITDIVEILISKVNRDIKLKKKSMQEKFRAHKQHINW